MQIVISHLTRMQPGYICVAGIDLETKRHIRPVSTRGQLTRDLLRKQGGVFEIGAIVELGKTVNIGRPPEWEDRKFAPQNLRFIRRTQPQEFWSLLVQTSADNLKSLFGNDLQQTQKGCTVPLGCGTASLGHLRPNGIRQLGINEWKKVRMQITDVERQPYLSVTDIRLYEADQTSPRHQILESLSRRIQQDTVIVAVGLSRPWRKESDAVECHWLQVNNLHLKDDPLGGRLDF
jgi:hypothetical protein